MEHNFTKFLLDLKSNLKVRYIYISDGIDYLIQASPRIEELHIKNISWELRDRMETMKFFSSIRFNSLTWLSITETHLFDSSYLPTGGYIYSYFIELLSIIYFSFSF